MTITEANAANVVLRFLLGAAPIPTEADALQEAEYLAERANKQLGAGLRATDVTAAWPDVAVG